jgi:hypothetical protein
VIALYFLGLEGWFIGNESKRFISALKLGEREEDKRFKLTSLTPN